MAKSTVFLLMSRSQLKEHNSQTDPAHLLLVGKSLSNKGSPRHILVSQVIPSTIIYKKKYWLFVKGLK